jgi:hypothetical protein
LLQNASTTIPSPQSSTAVRWIALIVWALIAVANLIKFVLDLISDYADMLIPCPSRLGSGGECNFVAVSSVEMDVLSSWGLTPHAYATAMTVPPVILMLVYGALAGLILWRQAVSWLGLIVSLTLVVFPVFFKAGDNDWSASSPFFLFIALVIGSTTGIIVIAFLYLIPNGRFAPRWAYIPMIVTCVLLAVMNLDINRVIVLPAEVMNLVQVALVGLVLFGASLQIYRYVRTSHPVERQQTKWILIGVLSVVFSFIVWLLIFGNTLAIPAGAPRLVANIVGLSFSNAFLLLILPVAITVAIQRYKLWNVDAIINRALVYGSLTGLLALIYFGSIIVLQRLFTTLTGQQSNLAIVISTLVIAVLFSPLRLRLQRGIDRRFFRQRYDAEKALEAFAAAARDEVDVEALRQELQGVIQRTMQPAHMAIWINERNSRERT